MKVSYKLIILSFFSCILLNFGLAQNRNKQIIGEWKGIKVNEYKDTTTEKWVFLVNKKGNLTKEMKIATRVLCLITVPFTWKINENNKIYVFYGKASCNCTTDDENFKKDMAGMSKSIAYTNSGLYDFFKLRFSNDTTAFFDTDRLTRVGK